MITAVMITVKVGGANRQYDMELPADIPVKDLLPQLLLSLRNIEDDVFLGVNRILMKTDADDRYLTDEETLDLAGVWDGSTVTVERIA